MVEPKAEIDLQFESIKLSTPWGYVSAIALCVTTFGTIALTSGFFLKPDATFDDYLADVVPLFAGFISILGVSEVCFLYFLIKLYYTYLMLLCDRMIQNYCGFNWYFQFILFAWMNNYLYHGGLNNSYSNPVNADPILKRCPHNKRD